jgi:energy-coupling factor transporter ATP-binding protein EcfA2
MKEDVLDTIITEFIKELISESKNIFKNLYDEGKFFVGADLKLYLEKQKNKYSHIKTLLKGNTPVFIYDIYFPINLLKSPEEKIVLTEDISNIFKGGNYVTIIGDAGSGKSTLTKHLFLNSIKNKFAIPILIELRYLNESGGDIEKYIIEKIFENRISPNSTILTRLLENGKFVFFLDGFDELNTDIKNVVVKNLNTFINTYDKNYFILTSRPYSDVESFPLFRNLKIKQLDKNKGEIDAFIDIQLRSENELAEKIKKSLKENKSEYIQSFLTNPLLLSLYILTFQINADIPDKKYIFYRRVINALFSEHDSKTKLGYVREKHSKLNQEQFEDLLRAFCFLSYFKSRFDFDYDYINMTFSQLKTKIKRLVFDNNDLIYDLKSAIALWTEDNGIYAFAHRSLQEYFTASFIKNLNPVENELAYKKIIDKLSNKSRSWELSNLLSLCNEMDEINFNKNYYIPLLKELLSFIDETNEESITKSFVLFFANGLICAKNGHYHESVDINDIVYKTIYIQLDYTRELYDQLTLLTEIPQLKKHPGLVPFGSNALSIQVLKFDGDIPSDIFNLIIKSPIKAISKKYLKFLKREIKNRENLIQNSKDTDRDLLELI